MSSAPFWPRKSPHFLQVRVAVRRSLEDLGYPEVVCVGLSGGADSLALCAALCAETRERNTRVLALCIDHGLQEGSREVAEAAAAQARRWGAKAQVIPVHVAPAAADGMEAEARRVRYAAFSESSNAVRSDQSTGDDLSMGDERLANPPVFVAHTAEDQAETLLLSALRGHASAMSYETEIEGARIVRPLLQIRRANTQGACAELEVEAWQDPHNEREDFRRVAMRKQILPMLSEIIGGDAIAPLAAAGDDIAADEDFFATVISEYEKGGGKSIEKSEELDCNNLSALAQPVRKRIIARWLVAKDIFVSRAGLAAIDALCSAWSGQGGVAVGDAHAKNPDSRLEVVRDGGKLRLLRSNAP